MCFRQYFTPLILILQILCFSQASAANLSAEQIEQFQKLPLSQQEALAKQYGIDMSQLSRMKNPSQVQQVKPNEPSILPRDTNTKSKYKSDDVLSRLTPFGYNVFAGQPTTFSPIDDLPAPNYYTLGVGDELLINIYGKDNKQIRAAVSRDGSIDIANLGPLFVAGLEFDQAKELITQRVKDKVLGVDVSISLGSLRTIQVSVYGDAFQPGSYNVNAFSTVTQVLKAAGGIDKLGSLREIKLTRNKKIIKNIDLYDFLVSGNTADDVRVESGDSIFISARKSSVYVRGDVVRPAIYETINGENLEQLFKYAGGISANGYQKSISVRRKLADGIKVFDVDFTTSKGKVFKVQDGDEIVVLSKTNYFNQDIVVRGAVVRPGVREFRSDIRVSDVIGTPTQGLNVNADLNYALVVREINSHRDIEVLQLDLGLALNQPGSAFDLRLKPRDQVIVFSNALDDHYWYGSGQNKTRDDWQKELLAQNLADQQREMLAMELSLAQQQSASELELGADNSNKPLANNDSNLKLNELENKEDQQEIDFDSRENLLAPVIERLMQQASLGSDVKIVEVRGAVKFPGVYPLTNDSTVKNLIIAGGGLRESAYEYTAELSRVDSDGGKFDITHERLELEQIMNNVDGSSILLRSKDRLNIFTKPEWREDYSIEVGGEVVFPGTYTFRRGETVKDIIERAGGLTKYAYPEGAIFSRESLRKQEAQRMELLNRQLRQEIASLTLRRQSSSARYTTSPGEALAVADQLDTMEPIGRLVIELPQILANNEEYDVLLENKDRLFIPPLRKVISVVGEVQFSSSHQYTNALTVEDYLSKAGGAKRQADLERMYVIRANGSVMLPNNSYWFTRKSEDLQPGDTIVVPIDTDYLDSLSAWTSATQILYQIGVAWNAIKN